MGILSKRYGLFFDGTNDYIRADSFNQVERTQAWTMSFLCRFGGSGSLSGTRYFFTTRFVTNSRGIAVRFMSDTEIQIAINNSGANRVVKSFTFTSIANTVKMIHITYSGNSNVSGLKLYFDGVEITSTTTIGNNLTATIINADNVCVLGSEQSLYFSATCYNFLWVDAVKSTTEITNDSNARTGLKYSYTAFVDLDFNLRQGLVITDKSSNAYTFNTNGQTVGDFRPLRA